MEPQNDLDYLDWMAKPKSVIFACPYWSKTTLAGFKSLKIISLLWSDSMAIVIYAAYIFTTSSAIFFYLMIFF